MKHFVFVTLLVCISMAAEIGRPNNMQRDVSDKAKDIIISHRNADGVVVGTTTLEVTCRGSDVTLSLTTTANSLFKQARLQVGARDPDSDAAAADPTGDCDSLKEDYSTTNAISIPTSQDKLCGRQSDIQSTTFTWNVAIREYLDGTVVEGIPPRSRTSFVTVKCSNPYTGDQEQVVANTPSNEGIAQVVHDVPFKLTNDGSDKHFWVLKLAPENDADLELVSYTIDTLSASIGNGDGETIKLIDNGCLKDVAGTRVIRESDNSNAVLIRVMAFQFTSNPNAPISFAANVKGCIKVGDKHCAPFDGCASANPLPVKGKVDANSELQSRVLGGRSRRESVLSATIQQMNFGTAYLKL